MAKISTYPFASKPSLKDYVIGTETNDNLNTKNFMISDIIDLIDLTVYVPYTGATQDVDLGTYSLYTYSLYMSGGPIWDADGSPGSLSQILCSQGPGSSPIWKDFSNLLPTNIYGSFYDTTTQTTAANTINYMKFNTVDFTNGVSITNDVLGNPTKINFSETGVYNIQFIAQLNKTSGGPDEDVYIYLIKDDVAVDNSTTSLTLVNQNHLIVASWNFFVEISSVASTCQIAWVATNSNIEIYYEASPIIPTSPFPTELPSIPSVILTVNKVS